MRKKLVYIAFICGILFSVTGEAAALSRASLKKKCREMMKANPPEISVIYNYGQLSYDKTKTTEEIAKIYRDSAKTEETLGKVQGLTLTNYYEQVFYYGRYEPLPDNFLCHFPAKVEVRIGYKNPVVYLASSLEEGSCEYKRVLRHEQTHLDFAHKSLGLYALILKKKIKDVVDTTGVKISRDVPAKVSGEFVKDYQLQLSALTELFSNVRNQQQKLIDTKENYLKEEMICNPYREAVNNVVKKLSEALSF